MSSHDEKYLQQGESVTPKIDKQAVEDALKPLRIKILKMKNLIDCGRGSKVSPEEAYIRAIGGMKRIKDEDPDYASKMSESLAAIGGLLMSCSDEFNDDKFLSLVMDITNISLKVKGNAADSGAWNKDEEPPYYEEHGYLGH